MDLFGSLFGQPEPVDWEQKRLLDEQLAREVFIREYGRTGEFLWSAYFRTLFELDAARVDAEYRAFLTASFPTPAESGTEDVPLEPSGSPRQDDP